MQLQCCFDATLLPADDSIRRKFESHVKKTTKIMNTERKELGVLYDQLKLEYQKGFTDVKKCSEMLEKLKVN